MTSKTPSRPALLKPSAAPALFSAVRGSSDRALVAAVAALLAAFALHAGAFLPRIVADRASETIAAEAASAPTPAVVARGAEAGPEKPEL
jgi:hypothetical protein